MNILKKIIPILGFIIIAVLTVYFRYIPKGKIWDSYKIIYVNKDAPAQEVEKLLSDAGIKESVSLANQRIPVMLTKNSPEETMLLLTLNSEENSYLYERQNYFYDSKGEYQLFYIPELYDKYIAGALDALKQKGYKAGADSSLPYLWFLPVIVLAIAILLLAFSKNKSFYYLMALMPCIFITCNAFYASAIAVIILLLCIFVISNLYGRKGALKKILKNFILCSALFISIIAAFSSAFIPGIFYLLSIAGAFCGFLISKNLKGFTLRKTEFSPVFIRSAAKVSPYAGRAKIVLPLLLVSSIAVIACFGFSSLNNTGVKSDSKVLIPGKASQQTADSRLPDIEKFFRWNWNVFTSPYKSLNNNSEYDENHVVYPRYSVNEGLIQRTNQVMYYDDSFRTRIYEGIDLLDFYSIESVIKSQGKDFIAGYTQMGSYNISFFSIIMMIVCFFMLLFIYFSAMIGKGGKR